jgi:hypothetical protein
MLMVKPLLALLLALRTAASAGGGESPVPSSLQAACYNATDRGCHNHLPLPLPLRRDLPQLLVVGDSVSMGYTPLLARALDGIYQVYHIGQEAASLQNCSGTQPGSGCGVANGGDTCRGFECLNAHDAGCEHDSCWLRRRVPDGAQWDVVLYNFGLHDIERDRAAGAAYEVPLARYTVLLSNITATLVARSKAQVWVTTTPMPAGTISPNRLNSDVVDYNTAAKATVKKWPTVRACDLYTFIVAHCGNNYTSCDWQSQPPHFPGHYDKLAGYLRACVLQQ